MYDISDRHQKRILGESAANGGMDFAISASSRSSSASSLPKVIEFQIAESPRNSVAGAGVSSMGLDGTEAMSLIDENSTLLNA